MNEQSIFHHVPLGVMLRRILHPILYRGMSSARKFGLQCFSYVPTDKAEPVIYAVNHTNSHDVPTACEVVDRHVYVLAGRENLRLIDKFTLWLNGVCFVDRKSKKSYKPGKVKRSAGLSAYGRAERTDLS